MEIAQSNQSQYNYEMLELEKGLQKAIERDELFLHYQPKISLNSGKIIGIETLVRWAHPEKGVISPADFIPLAEETGLAPKYLELEITESVLMDIQKGIQVLKELKSIGIQVSLDDFGTGYSSLLHLKELPINKLKIDQSFIRNCTVDTKDATIVKTIIAMATS